MAMHNIGVTTVQGLLSNRRHRFQRCLCDVWMQLHRRQAYAKQHGGLAQAWPEVGSGLIDWRRQQLEASMHAPTTTALLSPLSALIAVIAVALIAAP